MLLVFVLAVSCASPEPKPSVAASRPRPAPAAEPDEPQGVVIKGKKTDDPSRAAPQPDEARQARIRTLEEKAKRKSLSSAGSVPPVSALLVPGQWIITRQPSNAYTVYRDSDTVFSTRRYYVQWIEPSINGNVLHVFQELDSKTRQLIGARTYRVVRADAPPRGRRSIPATAVEETRQIGDRTVRCFRVDNVDSSGRVVARAWYSPDTPIDPEVEMDFYDEKGSSSVYVQIVDFDAIAAPGSLSGVPGFSVEKPKAPPRAAPSETAPQTARMGWDPLRWAAGQWVIERRALGDPSAPETNASLTYRWIDTGESGQLVLKSQSLDPDMQHGGDVSEHPMNDSERRSKNGRGESPGGQPGKYVTEAIGGQQVEVWAVDLGFNDGSRAVRAYSNHVPIKSPVREVHYDPNGTITLWSEIVEWGLTGGAEKPRR
jgi:hypothetical protein